MATYSSILAWKTPWPEEPGGAWWAPVHRLAESDMIERLSRGTHSLTRIPNK